MTDIQLYVKSAGRYFAPSLLCAAIAAGLVSCNRHENLPRPRGLGAASDTKHISAVPDCSQEIAACVSYLFPGKEASVLLVDDSYEITTDDLSHASGLLPAYAPQIRGIAIRLESGTVKWSSQRWLRMRVIESFRTGADDSGIFPVTPAPSYRVSLSMPVSLSPTISLICADVTNCQTRFETVVLLLERTDRVRVVEYRVLHFA